MNVQHKTIFKGDNCISVVRIGNTVSAYNNGQLIAATAHYGKDANLKAVRDYERTVATI